MLIFNQIFHPNTAFIPNALLSKELIDERSPSLANSGVVHPITGKTITKLEELLNDPHTKVIWSKGTSKELGRLAQGYEETPGTNTIFFMSHADIDKIPSDRTITYARIVVDERPQKEDPNRVRITCGGNLIIYPGELATNTATLTTSKLLWNSVLSTKNARYMCIDIKNMYLHTPLDRYEYMRIKASLIPIEFMNAYNLHEKVKDGYVYMEIRRGIYGLPQAGILANKLLKERLLRHGYVETKTPGLFTHIWRPIKFTLIVDDFGVEYVGQEHAQHLISSLQKYYPIEIDWTGSRYCGIDLKWNYNENWLDISMDKYFPMQLKKYNHPTPSKPQHSPFPSEPKKYGKDAQQSPPDDNTALLDNVKKKQIEKIVGSFLWYARAIDSTMRPALSAIAAQQSKPTEKTWKQLLHFLDYAATHPSATVRFYASNMILNVHSDASYLTEPKARSRIGGHFFLGSLPQTNQPIHLNGTIATVCSILKHVVSSAAEAELAALFHNSRESKIIRKILHDMGYPQPPIPIYCDNSTATSIVNNQIKHNRCRVMDMRYFWVVDQSNQKFIKVEWHPGLENLADYFTKHFPKLHHIRMRHIYLHTPFSPRYLPRALPPAALRGCAKTPDKSIQSSLPSKARVRTITHTYPFNKIRTK